MNIYKLAGIAAIAVFTAWSCEKSETTSEVSLQQEETVVAQENPANVILETKEQFDNALSMVDYSKISTAINDLSEAPGELFPAEEIKEGILSLLRSVLPEELSMGFDLPLFYSSIDETFMLMGELSSKVNLYLDENSGLYEAGPDNSGYIAVSFETPSGDEYLVMLGKGEASGYAGIKTSSTIDDYISIEKNDETLFSFFVYDDKDVLKTFVPDKGFMYSHVHSGELQISALTMSLDFDMNVFTGEMSYEMQINLGDIGISIPMLDPNSPLLYIKGVFKRTVNGLASKIAANQTISMGGLISFQITTSDLRKMVSLMASTITMQNPGMSEYMCNKLAAQWDETAHIDIEIGNEGDGGYVFMGCAPVHEDNPYFNLYAPCMYVYLYAYMEEVTIPEFLDMLSGFIPAF